VVRRNVIQKRLQRLNEYLSILQTLQKYSYAEFNGNPERYSDFCNCQSSHLTILVVI